jgi:hypothetical protein
MGIFKKFKIHCIIQTLLPWENTCCVKNIHNSIGCHFVKFEIISLAWTKCATTSRAAPCIIPHYRFCCIMASPRFHVTAFRYRSCMTSRDFTIVTNFIITFKRDYLYGFPYSDLDACKYDKKNAAKFDDFCV